MAKSAQSKLVKLDLNNPVFQENLLSLQKPDRLAALDTLKQNTAGEPPPIGRIISSVLCPLRLATITFIAYLPGLVDMDHSPGLRNPNILA